MLLSLACSRQREPAHPIHVAPEERGWAFVAEASVPAPLLEVRLLGFQVADDDGRRLARVTPAEIARWVAFANEVYRPAGIRFHFGPGDLRLLRSTRINDVYDNADAGFAAVKRAANEVSGRHPDRLVVFFRHGPGRYATGRGFAGIDFNFVVMPGWQDDWHCEHEHLGSLAHELGHHLGLPHTFARPFQDPDQAAAFLAQAGGDVRVFDGDGLTDTPPDPSIRSTECLDFEQVELAGVGIPLARRNIMSYYDQPDSLSAQQIGRVRWYLLFRRAYRMKLPRNHPAAAREAELLELSAQPGGRCSTQDMEQFGVGNWSGGRQLFCAAQGPQMVTVLLPVERPGLQRLELYATRAPDFGIVEVYLDGVPLGRAFDAWSFGVLASGAIPLGERMLQAGSHELTFVVRTKNPASTGFQLGIDAIALTPLQPLS
jgi:hypothetical protein